MELLRSLEDYVCRKHGRRRGIASVAAAARRSLFGLVGLVGLVAIGMACGLVVDAAV